MTTDSAMTLTIIVILFLGTYVEPCNSWKPMINAQKATPITKQNHLGSICESVNKDEFTKILPIMVNVNMITFT